MSESHNTRHLYNTHTTQRTEVTVKSQVVMKNCRRHAKLSMAIRRIRAESHFIVC